MPYPKNYSGGCSTNCGKSATRWVDIERFGDKRFVSWPYCDEHAESWRNDEGVAIRPLERQR